eukprot:3642127-Pyramimonas_sp.AAC.1
MVAPSTTRGRRELLELAPAPRARHGHMTPVGYLPSHRQDGGGLARAGGAVEQQVRQAVLVRQPANCNSNNSIMERTTSSQTCGIRALGAQ